MDGQLNWQEEMREALEELVGLLINENTVSAYELLSSGLVQTLLNVLSNVRLAWYFKLYFVLDQLKFRL